MVTDPLPADSIQLKSQEGIHIETFNDAQNTDIGLHCFRKIFINVKNFVYIIKVFTDLNKNIN